MTVEKPPPKAGDRRVLRDHDDWWRHGEKRWEYEPIDHQAHGNGAGPDDDKSELGRLRERAVEGDVIEKLPPPEPLIEGLLDLDTLAVMYGRPGSGKTHLAIDIALHVATGSDWHGQPVTPGHVLYVVAEGARGVGQRQKAWKQVNRYHDTLNGRITWLPVPVSLLDAVQVDALAKFAAERTTRLVVIDTLARSMAGGEENGFRDMSRVIDAVERIRAATAACVLPIHHSGKDPSAGGRGHSSLLGAVHTEIEVRNAGDGIITLAVTKQKDRPADTQPWRFVLTPAGDSVAVARYTGHNAAATGVSSKVAVTLEVLRSIALPGGVTKAQWAAAADETNVSRATFHRAVKSLVDQGLVSFTGAGATARFSPAVQAKS